MTRPATAADAFIERHPWSAYVLMIVMAFLMSLVEVSA